MRRLRAAIPAESGQGLVSGLLLISGVLIPLMFLVPLYARIEQAHLAADQAARDAVRSAVAATGAGEAEAAARRALERSRASSGVPLRLALSGRFARGALMSARVSASVELGSLPGLGSFGSVVVEGRASAPVDRYRSILGAPAP